VDRYTEIMRNQTCYLNTLAIAAALAAGLSVQGEIKVDVGGQAATPQPDWIPWITPERLGGAALSQAFSADFDADFTIAFDSVDTRQRGAVDPSVPLAAMLRSAFKRANPITMRIQSLNAGTYEMTMWHHDGNNDSKPSIDILVSDADEVNRLVVDDLLQSWGPGPVFSAGVGPAEPAVSTFLFRSDGANEVVITVQDNNNVEALYGGSSSFNEAFIAGFQIAVATPPTNPPPSVGRPTGTPFEFTISIQQTPPRLVNTNTVQVQLYGSNVPVQILYTAQRVSLTYHSPVIFPSEATLPIQLQFADTAVPASNYVADLTFLVPAYKTLTGDQARAPGSVDLNTPGFDILAHQVRYDAPIAHNLNRAEAQIRGRLIDPATGVPYSNLITGGPTFTDEDVLNWDQTQGGAGNFTWANGYAEEPMPGLPGQEGYSGNAAHEILTHLELGAGLHTLGVNSSDGFRLTAGLSPRDIFAPVLAAYDGTRSAADSTVLVYVPVAGLYPVRLLYFQRDYTGSPSLEFFSVDGSGTNWLINDRSQPGAIKAYRSYTGSPVPYVDYVNPAPDAAGVPLSAPIEVQMLNLGNSAVRMYLDGQEVVPSRQVSDGLTTLRYQPPNPWTAGRLYTVGLEYGGLSNVWSFRAIRGPKVALIVGNPDSLNPGDAGVKARLEAHGFEVYPMDDAATQASDVDGMVLIVISATVSSGNVAGKFTSVPIPVLNWEVNVQDDFLMTWNTSGVDLGETANQTNLVIVRPEHPLAAGLPAEAHTVVTIPQIFTWGWPNTNTAVVVATLADAPERACIYAYDAGQLLVDGTTPAPARRVHFFMQENAFAWLSEKGLKLFDAALSWALNQPLVIRFDPPVLENGKVRIAWKGPGVLQFASDPTGPWLDVPNASNPILVDPTGPARFFRIRP